MSFYKCSKERLDELFGKEQVKEIVNDCRLKSDLSTIKLCNGNCRKYKNPPIMNLPGMTSMERIGELFGIDSFNKVIAGITIEIILGDFDCIFGNAVSGDFVHGVAQRDITFKK